MTKGTKAFRIIISVLLAITMLGCAFFSLVVIALFKTGIVTDHYGLNIAGVEVTASNCSNILGDGTVSFNPSTSVLALNNAVIEDDYIIVNSQIDLLIHLTGENKFIVNGDVVHAIYAANNLDSKDVVFGGDGSLSIEFKGETTNAHGIYANNVVTGNDISIVMSDSSNICNGIYCDAALVLNDGANVSVVNGAGKYATAVKTRTNVYIELGSTLTVTARPGATDMSRAMTVGGSVFIGDNSSLSVTIDDETPKISECLNVAGLLAVGRNASLTTSSKKGYSIECYGSIELNEGATLTADSAGKSTDALCYGSVVNYGATVNGEIDVIGEIRNVAND